jgi:hypothetical protein
LFFVRLLGLLEASACDENSLRDVLGLDLPLLKVNASSASKQVLHFGGAERAAAPDRDRKGLRSVAEAVARPPLIHSLWSWRPLGVLCRGLARQESGKPLARRRPFALRLMTAERDRKWSAAWPTQSTHCRVELY